MVLLTACSQQYQQQNQQAHVPNSRLLQDLHYLSSDELKGRKVGTDGSARTQEYLIKQLSKAHIEPFGQQYLAPFVIDGMFKSIQGNNVIALVPGREVPDKFIVLSAHFDHIGGHGGRIYNGADDNASGTSALLHYASKLKKSPLRYSVILLFTDGEEVNLKGANAFVEQNSELIANIMLNINIDMIAGNSKTKRLRYISRGLDTLLSEQALNKLASQRQQAPIPIKKGFRQLGYDKQNNNVKWEVASDHGVFYRQKIPFIYFGVGTHSNYHQTSDTYNNVNHTFFEHAVDTIYQQLAFIDQNL